MKSPIYVLATALVVGVAFWAYQVNYRTKAALEFAHDLQREIDREREAISVLEVEWAWLNRPERLQSLVALHMETLGLMPLHPDHFGELRMVAYPVEDMLVAGPVPVQATRLPMTLDEAFEEAMQ
ncbi:cell division protein FtsL [Roseobacter sp. HKCCA0434]|uniref:cell division protein FtsL n=1 Tax=Roseobacter sp. HKCCA0434 TaxID=3079297 RepID=UPI0029059209|nr:cell division protein FtsL [Roseobacter sp. HKCCA0434]